MTLTRRLLFRFSTAILGLSALLVALCVTPVDFQPYFRTAYYQETHRRLLSVSTNQNAVVGELAAGFGQALLNPTLNAPQDDPEHGHFRELPLAGYGDRHGASATGVHDDLWVKAVAFKVQDHLAVIATADALIVPREVAAIAMARLASEFNLRREQVYFSATHTHSSLGGWGEGKVAEAFAGPFHPGVREWMATQIVAAVRAALSDLHPAALGSGRFAIPEFVRNRVAGSLGRVDPEFSYLLVKQLGGTTTIIGSYSAHATVLSSSVMQFSADYPGAWQRAVESLTGGHALFLAGGVGSHAASAGAGSFGGVDRMGQALARAVVEQLPRTYLTNRITFALAGLPVSMPPLNPRISDGWRVRPWLARRILPVEEQTFLQALRLGNAVWASTPCDFSGELALDVKDSLRSTGCNVVVTSFNGDYIGYVISPRYYHLSGYEPRLMSFFGPNVPDYFVELIRGLVTSLTPPPP